MKVVSIPKTGDLTNVNNYRPISLLPTPGKILEKIVHAQIEEYIEDEELLSNHQYGFRKQHSTIHAVSQLLNHVFTNFNNSISTVALFIDFRKAFDCLQYPILLRKLRSLNLSQQVLDWLKNYLTDRTQITTANGVNSESKTVKQVVPQGLILGPLLYIIYANDLASTITHSKIALYADDTVIYSSSKDINKALRNIQKDLDQLAIWCTNNSIHINPDKTKFLIFSTKKVEGTFLQLKIGDQNIEQKPQFNYT